MYNGNILRADFTTFVPTNLPPPLCDTIIKPKLSFLKKKQVRKWYANFLCFELRSLVGKKVTIAQISLNSLASIPRNDTNRYNPLYSSKNHTT